jgi:glycosyltransferase involved in cell wall biosynthesis
MVIAHVVSSLALGGQERLVVELARRQRRQAEAVLAVSLGAGGGPLGDELTSARVEVVAVAKRPGLDPTLSPRLYRLLRGRGVDVVHTHNRMPLLYAAPAGKLAGARVVHTKHGPGVGTRRERWLRRQAARFTDAYVAVSEETAATGRGDCPPAKMAIVANGVDTALFRPDARARAEVRRELGIDDSAWVVGTVGRLAPEKDQSLLLRAVARQGVAISRATVMLVGDGPEAARLRAEAAALGLVVHFLGVRRDVPRVLAALDVFALSSRLEGLPLALLEAMAVGLPAVVTDVGGMGAAVGRAGLLVPAGDAGAMATALARLAADRGRARELGAEGRRAVVERFSVERMVQRYWALYEAR